MKPPQIVSALSELDRRIRHELEERVLYFVAPNRAVHYDNFAMAGTPHSPSSISRMTLKKRRNALLSIVSPAARFTAFVLSKSESKNLE